MARLIYTTSGSLGADPGLGTTVTFALAPTFATLTGTDYVPLILGATVEIVYLTAYTAGATTGTIKRAQENTTAVAHPGGTWACDLITGVAGYVNPTSLPGTVSPTEMAGVS
jgi:hypothetical protein